MKKESKRKRLFLLIISLALLVLALFLMLIFYLKDQDIIFNKGYFGVVDQSVLIETDYDSVPQDMLYITKNRKNYEDAKMRLIVPALDLDVPVGENTRPQDLEKMPGLYEFSQMPSAGDVNVSITAHRDIFNREFYSLDKVSEGDYFYLVYEDTVYKYVFYDLKIVADDDWSVLYRQGFSALTLTTCDPIGTRLNRLVSVGILVDIYPMADDLEFS